MPCHVLCASGDAGDQFEPGNMLHHCAGLHLRGSDVRAVLSGGFREATRWGTGGLPGAQEVSDR